MGRLAAFGTFINWRVYRPLALLYNGGPFYGPFPIFSKDPVSKHPEFSEFTLPSFFENPQIYYEVKVQEIHGSFIFYKYSVI